MGTIFVASVAIGQLADFGWNPSGMIRFSSNNHAAIEYVESSLGNVIVAPASGHDGQYFFFQSLDPLYSNPDTIARFLDRPTYRAQRMLYPTLAGGFGAFSPRIAAFGLLAVNLIAVGVGTVAVAKLAVALDLSPLFGLTFALNPGVLVSATADTADTMALALLMIAALYAIRSKYLAASAWLTLAALTRETMLVAAVGLLVFLMVRQHRLYWPLLAPFLAAGAWWAFVTSRIGYLPSLAVEPVVGLPLKGFGEAIKSWIGRPIRVTDLVLGLVLALIVIWVGVRAIWRPNQLTSLLVGFSVIGVTMSAAAWTNYFDSYRILAPLIAAGPICLAAEDLRDHALPAVQRASV